MRVDVVVGELSSLILAQIPIIFLAKLKPPPARSAGGGFSFALKRASHSPRSCLSETLRCQKTLNRLRGVR